ncbi:MAG: hypothetical protein HWE22_06240 [Flavobacteriales bacterium]|nr:hypothetical protein [Flavobacteriales bacterium]
MNLVTKLGIPAVIIGMTIGVFSCEKEVFEPKQEAFVDSFVEKDDKLDPPPSVDEYENPPTDSTDTVDLG